MPTSFSVGDIVRCKPPYDVLFPGELLIVGLDDAGNAMIEGEHGLDDGFLELVAKGPGAVTAPPPRVAITQFAFENRFTVPELIAIDLASVDNPQGTAEQRQFAAALRVERRLLEIASYVDLTHPEIIQGVRQLEQAGLLAPGRAAAILSTVTSPEELA